MNHYLTTKYFIKGKICDLFEKIMKSNNSNEFNMSLYKLHLIKWFKKQDNYNLTSVGLFKHKNIKVIVKIVNFTLKNSIYEQLINEHNMLKLLYKYNNKASARTISIKFPKIIKFVKTKNQLILISEYFEAPELFYEANNKKVIYISKILMGLRDITNKLDKDTYKLLPKRTSTQIIFTLPFYLIKAILNDSSNLNKYFEYGILFYKHYFSRELFHKTLVLAHRDLHSRNILVKNDQMMILDPEISVLADYETDIAHIARYYAEELALPEMMEILNKELLTDRQKKNFIALTIYYAIQMMGIRANDDPDYHQAHNYMFEVFPKIKLELFTKLDLTPAEKLYNFTLNFISYLNKIVKLDSTHPIILCYHSISNDTWRFSTPVNDFHTQLNFLVKKNKLISYRDLIQMNKNTLKNKVLLTFDDGYEDLANQISYFKKYNIKGILFILGTPTKANRSELDNQKSFMTIKQIQEFKSAGWEIGFHTNTHSDLSKLNSSQLKREIVLGKKTLEQKLGFNIDLFAYPRGIYSKNIINVVKTAGFKYAFTVDGNHYSKDDNLYAINRVGMEGKIDLRNFQALISPLGIFFNKNYMSLLKLKNNLGI